jgi:hypothetical protein
MKGSGAKNPRGMAARAAVDASDGDGADRVHVVVAAAFGEVYGPSRIDDRRSSARAHRG